MIQAAYEPRIERRVRRLPVRGIDYCVHEWGKADAAPLLMLHGWGDVGAAFQFVVDALQDRWRVLAPDWRGFGDSGHNPDTYWFPDYLADLDALLEALVPDTAVPLVGHSMGGNVAALYAGTFPERVARFVNVEGFGLPDSDPADAPGRYRRWVESGRERREHPGYQELSELVARIRARSPGISKAHAAFVARLWTDPDATGRFRLKADIAHRRPNPVLYRRGEAEACWRQITAPTLLVSGADTQFSAAAADWRAGRWAYPQAQHVEIAGAGHMLHFEQPARLAGIIEDFLDAG